MTSFAHIASGYLIYKLSESSVQIHADVPVLGLAIVGSLIPDIDGLFGNKLNNHRYTIFHAPLFWFSVVTLLYIVGVVLHSVVIQQGIGVFGVGVFIHLLLDWMSARTCGIMLWFPFSKKIYSLFPGKKYASFWKFYCSNKSLITLEIGIILLALGVRFVV